uniref:Ig-like domain-containing protein n=1 Tax=Sander lucioperca TaxID=283035 RepID=A0A8C9Z7P2_SANLU
LADTDTSFLGHIGGISDAGISIEKTLPLTSYLETPISPHSWSIPLCMLSLLFLSQNHFHHIFNPNLIPFFFSTITKLVPGDMGLYVCKVSNNVGTTECSTELRVIDKPNFVKPLGPIAAVVGAPLHLECQVDEDTGVTVTWTRDGRKVHQSPDCKLSFEDKTVTLDILKTTLKDCGNYVCTVTNEAGSESCSTSVKVQGKRCLSS